MSFTSDRESFMATMSKHGFDQTTCRLLMRYSTTLQHLAVAQCNGDFPCDNGVRPVVACKRCEGLWSKRTLNKAGICKDCQTADLVRRVMPDGWKPVFGGDPRGAVLCIAPVTMLDSDIDCGRARPIYVPCRRA